MATWSKGITAADVADLTAVAGDAQNNLIVAGSFDGTVNLGGAPLTQQGAGENLFLAKYDCAGNHVWSKQFGAPTNAGTDYVYALAVAGDGSILITGGFQGVLDFGTGPLPMTGMGDGFMAKLDAAGNPVFARSFSGGTSSSEGTSVAVDAAGNAYFTGSAFGPQDFGGGLIGAGGEANNLFVVELDPAGNHLWSKAFGTTDGGPKLAIDPSGDLVLAGDSPVVSGPLDFGGGPLPSSAVYATKLTPAGGFVWAKTWGTPGDVTAAITALTTGPSGEIVLTGDYNDGSIDFGGGPLPVAPSSPTAYLVKLTGAGAFVFDTANSNAAAKFSDGWGVSVNASGDVYLLGDFSGTIDLGGGPIVAGGTYDVLFAKFAPTGTLSWLESFGGPSNSGYALALDTGGTPYIAGTYTGTLDLGNGTLPVETGTVGTFFGRVAQ